MFVNAPCTPCWATLDILLVAVCGYWLSAVQYAILVVLAEETVCDQQTLGNRAGFDKATGTYVIDRMSKSGLLKVETDATNRRRKLVTMTAAGETMLNLMVEQAKSAEKMITAHLDMQDIADLKRLLSKLGGLQEPEDDAANNPR
ncbi:MarR family winged helix-turn-helix transcriptional regulator [Pantoea rwandensis]|uniref:MarR family winged helix-turn-helix transcriptional regulator n=1 Tax=Pantoea rwandensis TaxID=1076550 RepID=UPI001FE7D4D2|nr:MarR family winged helix-turn-helix transcriptional regulator [Pantoea rwandensis]